MLPDPRLFTILTDIHGIFTESPLHIPNSRAGYLEVLSYRGPVDWLWFAKSPYARASRQTPGKQQFGINHCVQPHNDHNFSDLKLLNLTRQLFKLGGRRGHREDVVIRFTSSLSHRGLYLVPLMVQCGCQKCTNPVVKWDT